VCLFFIRERIVIEKGSLDILENLVFN
jgi:hypothetical protein